ncbi:ArsR/SmtB family transcription factor [Desulfofustis limnaeus]|jgi:ArsR family transcriptional regulator|uniref:HTH arsR-type domain-containing protein n=1 Tax=Desulfofustis limnaeus TaxID=2740163 RepID=A0ABM7W9V4_9BACT|nr:metalloregulator ArsR/SmtB family transcription factor [Desulfofustis limnaeus]MDX9896387.1 metalloregulator ArsR/SmtB family transcription factor [Desulfofustis sp.]BDD87761.1 hypothetical protein DPPLL_21260 [Desulfofustis limnaeus]
MREFIKVMKALSDPNRVKIVKLLQHRVLCVCEIQALLGLAQSTASKHLKVLEEAGLVDAVKEGQWVNYRPATGTRSVYATALLVHLRQWLDDDDAFLALLHRLPTVQREDIRGSCGSAAPVTQKNMLNPDIPDFHSTRR